MTYSSWDIECDRQKLVIMGHFLSFNASPPESPKNQNFEKNENKLLEISSSYKKKSYNVCLLRYGVRQTEFFVILGQFLVFYFPHNPENQNVKKMKKAPGDVTILHMYTINDNYDVWLLKYEVWQT